MNPLNTVKGKIINFRIRNGKTKSRKQWVFFLKFQLIQKRVRMETKNLEYTQMHKALFKLVEYGRAKYIVKKLIKKYQGQ